ncbi:MAG: SixA phosphatase family protein [Gemmatimonadota bacterium]
MKAGTLLVIRHARAEDRDEFAKTGASDDARPLTDDGWERMRGAAKGLCEVVKGIDLLATSPLVRARQTAEIVAAGFQIEDIVEVSALRPGAAPAELYAWLRGTDAGTVAVVGHATHLDELVSWLLTGKTDAIVSMKKGAAIMLELGSLKAKQPEAAKLLWALTPGQLRSLGA